MKYIGSERHRRLLITAVTTVIVAFACHANGSAQPKYQAGDRVLCNTIGSSAPQYEKFYEKGTVLPFRATDQPDGSWYRVKIDSNNVEYYCKLEHIRPIAGTQALKEAPPAHPDAGVTKADGDFVECPIKQKQAKNGSRPDVDLIKKLIRCAKREKAVDEGDEGAVKVDISEIQVGAARPWSYRQDLGNGKAGTVVYPVKATYSVSTFYRTATEVEAGWVRILNFYVNAFGEWAIGSEENVKSPKVQRIQK